MKILFVADPLHTFKTYKDSTFAMMRGRRTGSRVVGLRTARHRLAAGSQVQAHARRITLTGAADDRFDEQEVATPALAGFDAVLMRKDPPSMPSTSTPPFADPGRTRGRPRFQQTTSPARTPGKLAILEFPLYIAPPWSPATWTRCAPFMPSIATSSQPWMAWAAWAFSGSRTTD